MNGNVARPLKSISVKFSAATSLEPPCHPIFCVSPTSSSLSSLHSKRVSDVDSMVRQEELLRVQELNLLFVIDLEWWNRWRSFDEISSELPFNEKIDNWKLLNNLTFSEDEKSSYDYKSCQYHLNPKLELNKHFICISENVWTALRSWYGGGPPLPRMIKSRHQNGGKKEEELEVNLYPVCPLNVQEASTLNVDAIISDSLDNINLCFCCQKSASNRCKGCSFVYYCSHECQFSHWKYHKTWCKLAAENRGLEPVQIKSVVPTGRKGKTGLVNLGNSCYMNSGLQCLSHVSSLTNFLLSDKYVTQLNVKNVDGSGGQLVKDYSHLLRDLWFGSQQYISPVSFKRVFGRINPEYAGFSQHDVYEAFESLIDKIHEDLNKIVQKPYTEMPEGDGTNDDEISRLAWVRLILYKMLK